MKKLLLSMTMVGLAFVFADNILAQENVALNKQTSQSSTAFDSPSSKAVDGITTGIYSTDPNVNDITHTNDGNGEWWQVDLGKVYDINKIEIWNRKDDCCWDRLKNFYVMVSEVPITSNSTAQNTTTGPHSFTDILHPSMILTESRRGRYVRIFLDNKIMPLSLAEVQVFGREATSRNNQSGNKQMPRESYDGDDAGNNDDKTPLSKEEFSETLIGVWTNEREKVIVDATKMIFYFDGKLQTNTAYRVVDGKTVEFTDSKGNKNKAIMTLKDDNTTLVWHRPDLKETFIYKRQLD